MVNARTVGSLCGFTINEEAVYGVGNSSAGNKYGGSLISHNDKSMADFYEDPSEGSRVYDTVTKVGKDYGFSADFRMLDNTALQLWWKLALGSVSGVANTLPSFSARFSYAADEHQAFFGCKIDSFSIKADGRGKPYTYSADVISRYASDVASGSVFSNLGTSYTFNPVTKPSAPPMCYTFPLKYNVSGNTLVDAKAKSWSLEVKNNLQSEPDAVTVGSDLVVLNAGLDSVPQASDITLSFDVLSTSSLWDEFKQDNQQMRFSVKISSTYYLVMSGYLTGEMPSRSQGTYDETIKVRIKDVALKTTEL